MKKVIVILLVATIAMVRFEHNTNALTMAKVQYYIQYGYSTKTKLFKMYGGINIYHVHSTKDNDIRFRSTIVQYTN